MTNPALLSLRLPVLVLLLVAIEAANMVKLAVAMSWSNEGLFGVVTAIVLGAFLVGGIVASSFDLESDVRWRLHLIIALLFATQLALTCIVSFLISTQRLPADRIGLLFGTPPEITRRVVALTEGATINLAAFGTWGVLARLWRSEIAARQRGNQERKVNVVQIDARLKRKAKQ